MTKSIGLVPGEISEGAILGYLNQGARELPVASYKNRPEDLAARALRAANGVGARDFTQSGPALSL